MAPSKPKQSTKPVNKDRVSDDARVAKRPQRGFHRFKDGSLNVAPKSKEEEDILEANQESSPLLQLPAEIRDMIWRYALRGKTFVTSYKINPHTKNITKAKLKRARKSLSHATALLHTCRQLYLETATYPLTLGSLSCDEPRALVAAVKKLRVYQQKQVSRIRMRLTTMNVDVLKQMKSDWCPQMIRRSLPAAKSLELVFIPAIHELIDGYIDSVREDFNKVWREEDGWTVTVRITSGK